jgi:vacuolar-type H+-ATPase subunit I/STV1
MSSEQNLTDGTAQVVDTTNGEVTLESLQEKVKLLEANYKDAVSSRDKTKQKLREIEESAGSATELKAQYENLFTEKSKLAEQFEATVNELTSIKEGMKQEKISSALTTALEAAGAKSINTVMKLIDKSKLQLDEEGKVNSDSVVAAIKEVMDSDPILFGDVDPKKVSHTGAVFSDPGVKLAGDSKTEGAYEKELRAAKNQKEILAVAKKYGKI